MRRRIWEVKKGRKEEEHQACQGLGEDKRVFKR